MLFNLIAFFNLVNNQVKVVAKKGVKETKPPVKDSSSEESSSDEVSIVYNSYWCLIFYKKGEYTCWCGFFFFQEPLTKAAVPGKKQQVASKNGSVGAPAKKGKADSSSSDSSDESDEDEVNVQDSSQNDSKHFVVFIDFFFCMISQIQISFPYSDMPLVCALYLCKDPKNKTLQAAKNGPPAKKVESGDSSEDNSSSDSDSDNVRTGLDAICVLNWSWSWCYWYLQFNISNAEKSI